MKKLLLTFVSGALIFLSSISAYGQSAVNHNRCSTLENTNFLRQGNPDLDRQLQEAEDLLQQYIADHANDPARLSTIPDTIPVVVHVVYHTNPQNISDAQIISQINILNNDFGRTNADTSNTPAIWKTIGGSIPYRFQLARRDPNGNSTTGITRTHTDTLQFDASNNYVKHNNQGGVDSWNTNIYLNIWIAPLCCNYLGYGEFPVASVTATRGLVCNFNAFGNTGAAAYPYNKGRTSTHEIGHCFNLRHIWGDDNGACTGTDGVTDTPNQGAENYGAPTYPLVDNCSTVNPGVMFMNYMDYTDDRAMNIFTAGQATRMTSAIQFYYSNAINSIGLDEVTGLGQNSFSANNIRVSPNPGNGKIHVQSNEVPAGDRIVSVCNMIGEKVFEQNFRSSGIMNEDLDLSGLKSGVYLLKLSAGDTQAVKKLVIN